MSRLTYKHYKDNYYIIDYIEGVKDLARELGLNYKRFETKEFEKHQFSGDEKLVDKLSYQVFMMLGDDGWASYSDKRVAKDHEVLTYAPHVYNPYDEDYY